jgi:type IV secretory pathway VirB10-like protein
MSIVIDFNPLNYGGQIMNTKPLAEFRVIIAIFVVGGVLLFLVITPILSSKTDTDIKIAQVNESLPGLKGLPKGYPDIKAEGTPVPPPPDPEPVIPQKPENTDIDPKPKVIVKVEKEVVPAPVKKEPTEFEMAIEKARTAPLSFKGLETSTHAQSKQDYQTINVSLKKPGTRYIIQASTILPATTLTGINSDLPGHAVAMINRNIYDSVTGEHLLIPQGSKLLGSYTSNIKLNQKRVQVSWREIKFRDGSTIVLGKGMPGIGTQGMAGLKGSVDNHYLANAISIFSVSLMKSSARQVSKSGGDSLHDDVSGGVAGEFSEAGSDIFREQIQIGPSIEVPLASNISILVTRDLYFEEPYHGKRY